MPSLDHSSSKALNLAPPGERTSLVIALFLGVGWGDAVLIGSYFTFNMKSTMTRAASIPRGNRELGLRPTCEDRWHPKELPSEATDEAVVSSSESGRSSTGARGWSGEQNECLLAKMVPLRTAVLSTTSVSWVVRHVA